MSNAQSSRKIIKKYTLVYFLLLILLAITVGLAKLPFPLILGYGFALGIAALKAGLVLAYFMKLNTGSPKIRFFAFAAFIWTALLMGLISIDYLTRGMNGILGK